MAAGGLPALSGKRVVQALTKAGFYVERVVGSHHILASRGDLLRSVSVPVHGNRELKRGTLRSILRQTGLSSDQLLELL